MSLKDWSDNGWLKIHKTDKQEIQNLLKIVERDISDANNTSLSPDWQFGIAYNAALKLCTIIVYLQGYRPENTLAHYRTIMSLKEIPGQNWTQYCAYLNSCRIKRNNLEYDSIEVISLSEAKQLLDFLTMFKGETIKYIQEHFPDFLQK